MRTSKLSMTTFAAFAAVILAGVAGWLMNIFAIVSAVSEPITAMFILRCVGIFIAPLGAILGYV